MSRIIGIGGLRSLSLKKLTAPWSYPRNQELLLFFSSSLYLVSFYAGRPPEVALSVLAGNEYRIIYSSQELVIRKYQLKTETPVAAASTSGAEANSCTHCAVCSMWSLQNRQCCHTGSLLAIWLIAFLLN